MEHETSYTTCKANSQPHIPSHDLNSDSITGSASGPDLEQMRSTLDDGKEHEETNGREQSFIFWSANCGSYHLGPSKQRRHAGEINLRVTVTSFIHIAIGAT